MARSPVSNQPSEPVPSQALYGSPPVIPFPALAHPFQKPAPKPVEKKLPEYTKSPFSKFSLLGSNQLSNLNATL